MVKYGGARALGPSTVIRFCPVEDWQTRHRRRLEVNLSLQHELYDWCDRHEISMSIKAEGNHWCFKKGDLYAVWSPSTANFVFRDEYEDRLHLYDIYQVQQALREHGFTLNKIDLLEAYIKDLEGMIKKADSLAEQVQMIAGARYLTRDGLQKWAKEALDDYYEEVR